MRPRTPFWLQDLNMINKIKTYISPFVDWRILIIYLPIWFLASGWTYVFIALGTHFQISWMLAAGSLWATILWLPITPEKLITIPLTLYIYVKLFGRGNEKLERMLNEARTDWSNTKVWMRRNYYKIGRTLTIIIVTIITILILIGSLS